LRGDFSANFHKIDHVINIKHQVDDALGAMEEHLKRDLDPEIHNIGKHLQEVEKNFIASDKQKDISIRSIMETLEDQSESIEKIGKDMNRQFSRHPNDEKLEDLRSQLSNSKILSSTIN